MLGIFLFVFCKLEESPNQLNGLNGYWDKTNSAAALAKNMTSAQHYISEVKGNTVKGTVTRSIGKHSITGQDHNGGALFTVGGTWKIFTACSFSAVTEYIVDSLLGAYKTLQEKFAAPAASQNEDANRKAKEEADRKAKEDADRKAKEETDGKAKEDADRIAKEEADRKAKEEADRKAKEDADRIAKEEADRKAKEDADKKAKEAAIRTLNIKKIDKNIQSSLVAEFLKLSPQDRTVFEKLWNTKPGVWNTCGETIAKKAINAADLQELFAPGGFFFIYNKILAHDAIDGASGGDSQKTATKNKYDEERKISGKTAKDAWDGAMEHWVQYLSQNSKKPYKSVSAPDFK